MNTSYLTTAVLTIACLHCSSSLPPEKTTQTPAPLLAPEPHLQLTQLQATVREPSVLERDTRPLFDEPNLSLIITRATWVMATPSADSGQLGLIAASTRVVEKAHLENQDCPTPWVEIEPQGWVCVAVKPSELPPTAAESKKRMKDLPGVYAIASKATRFYPSMEAAEEEAGGRLAKGDIVKRRQTVRLDNGKVLWRTDRNEYVDASSLKRMSGSRFEGVDLTDEHGPMLPFGFAVNAGNAKKAVQVWNRASADAKVVQRLSARSVVEILDDSEDSEFVAIGEGRWIKRMDVRIVAAHSPPTEIEVGERWIDVDLEQQLVVAYEGSEAVFATLASTGKGINATPTGVFNITRKKRQTTMQSDRSKKQTYSVAVPWPVYFNEGVAFHSTYWHNSFGVPKSHGCVNLSPSDAATIYRFVGPEMPAGWTVVYGHESQPGTMVQVRSVDGAISEDGASDSDQRLASQ